MAIKATFEADFSNFQGAVKTAEASLNQFAGTAQKIPKEFQNMSSGASAALGDFHTGLSAVDRTLASLGVNIGPQVRALQELSVASGKTASQLGAVATAGLLAAATMGGWQIGRIVSDFFGLDEVIGNATAKLLNLGDIAGQQAGAGLDVLARASKIAGYEITNFAEAQKIIIASNTKFQESINTSEFRVRQWGGELRKVMAAGDLDLLRKDLEAGNGTLKQLSAQYHVSIETLQWFQRETKATAEAQKILNEELRKSKEKMASAMAELAFAGNGWRETLAGIDALTVAGIQHYLALGVAQSDLATVYNKTALQVKSVAMAMADQTAVMGLTEPKIGSLEEWTKKATKANDLWYESLLFIPEGLAAIIPPLDAIIPKLDAIIPKLDAVVPKAQALGDWGGAGVGIVTMGAGSPAGPQANGNIIRPSPFAYGDPLTFYGGGMGSSGGSVVNNNTFHVNGTPEESARQIADILARNVRANTKMSA